MWNLPGSGTHMSCIGRRGSLPLSHQDSPSFFFQIKDYCHPAGLWAPGQEGRASVAPYGSLGNSPGVTAEISGLLERGVPQV